MALNDAALQQQLTVHTAGTKCQTTRVTNKNEEIYQNSSHLKTGLKNEH